MKFILFVLAFVFPAVAYSIGEGGDTGMAGQNASAATADFTGTTSRQAHDSFYAGTPRHHREVEAAEPLRAQQSGRDPN